MGVTISYDHIPGFTGERNVRLERSEEISLLLSIADEIDEHNAICMASKHKSYLPPKIMRSFVYVKAPCNRGDALLNMMLNMMLTILR